jgi:acyl carrier protein
MASDTSAGENARKAKIVEAIWSVYAELVNFEGELAATEKEEIRLFGTGSKLDSFELVNLILDIEQEISSRFGVSISLMDERAMSQRTSPYRTIQTLVNFIDTLIGEGDE